MRIGLISLYDLENSAVRVLAHFLRQRGHHALEVYFKDWKNNGLIWPAEVELRHLVSELRRFGVQAIGLSLRASAYLRVCRHLIRRLRHDLPGVPIIVGGIHATLAPQSLVDCSDYLVLGDGEATLDELLSRIESGEDAAHVVGTWAIRDGIVTQNPMRPLEQDLTRISRRDWLHPDKVVLDGRHHSQRDPLLVDPIFLTSASRGCPFHCSFCYNSTLRRMMRGLGRYFRTRPVDDVLDELREARAAFPHLRRVRFDDEIFPMDPRWLDEFIRRYPSEVGLPFECFLEPRMVSDAWVEKLARAGLDIVYLGIQASARVSEALYHRRQTPDRIRETAFLFHRLGIHPRYLVMMDDPLSTEEDHRQLFRLLCSFPRPFRVYLFSMTVMPGTELERMLLERGDIRPYQVEGEATKTFYQYRVSLDWPRPPTEAFWVALMVLVNKPWLPRRLLLGLSENHLARRHPAVLSRLAMASNFIHVAGMVPASIRRGEIGVRVLRRFWTPGTWITA